MDIGPFYVEECCLAAGFDGLGNLKGQVKPPSEIEQKLEAKSQTVAADVYATESTTKLSRGKLKDMRLQDLIEIAKSKGIEVNDQMTKKQLINAILS